MFLVLLYFTTKNQLRRCLLVFCGQIVHMFDGSNKLSYFHYILLINAVKQLTKRVVLLRVGAGLCARPRFTITLERAEALPYILAGRATLIIFQKFFDMSDKFFQVAHIFIDNRQEFFRFYFPIKMH